MVITFFAGMADPVLMQMELEYAYACKDIPGIYVKHQVKNQDKVYVLFFSYEIYVQ